MTPSLKKLCIFGLATGVGQLVLQQTDDDRTAYRAQKLAESGQDAVDKCGIKVDRSMINRVRKKIDQVCIDKTEFDIVEMLSFLFLGLVDLELVCNEKTTALIEPIRKRALWFMRIYDPKLDQEDNHARAMKKYNDWIDA